MELIGHRGLIQKNIQENTLASIKNALKHKLKILEIDLRKTKDNQIVLHHDRDFTSHHHGYYIDQLTLKELKKLKNITTLNEAFKAAKRSRFFLDIKVAGAEQEILRVIKKNKMQKKVIIDSFLPSVTKRFTKLAPKLERAAPFINTTWKGIMWYPFYTFFFPKIAKDLQATYIEFPAPFVTKKFVDKCKTFGLKTSAFYFKKNKEIKNAIDSGIDYLMLDTVNQVEFARNSK